MQRENEKEKTVVMSVFGVREVLVSMACTCNRIQKLHQMQLEPEPGVSPASRQPPYLSSLQETASVRGLLIIPDILMGRL